MVKYPVINIQESARIIREFCKAKGYSASDIQKALHLRSVQAVYKWWHGEAMPRLDNLIALAMFLEVDINQLIHYDIMEIGDEALFM